MAEYRLLINFYITEILNCHYTVKSTCLKSSLANIAWWLHALGVQHIGYKLNWGGEIMYTVMTEYVLSVTFMRSRTNFISYLNVHFSINTGISTYHITFTLLLPIQNSLKSCVLKTVIQSKNLLFFFIMHYLWEKKQTLFAEIVTFCLTMY